MARLGFGCIVARLYQSFLESRMESRYRGCHLGCKSPSLLKIHGRGRGRN